MTTAYERTRSVIETGGFLARISRDKTLPDYVREQARQLLRHYPTAEAVRLAGRCEAIRQDEVSKLSGSPRALHPALSTWPLLDPFFYDPTIHDASHPSAPPVVAGYTALQPSPRTEESMVAASFRILGLVAPAGTGCLSIEHRCFTSARALVLSRATVVLGSPSRARDWFEGRIRSLDKQLPCTLMNNVHELTLVMDTLFRLEHGIF
ncbi:Uncharacterized protein ALO43_02160 [Pseudomonas tremae]|uniref:Antitoxin Xre/MbcA/ParS-like toxin-binding domain-containing protein n=2 Tax=Pseudomonas TaxID=286 RepID=A0AA40TV09_9PSED|nr:MULTISPECIES: BPSL0761 family protein [Pseudomonas]KPZ00798.1 Uncharacterized protein ALO43_02160 [Pseudomonas tremae]RMO07845.1 hypothetical protein ALQ48_00047 [Pseudomonas coronafaciens pv. zizaniae]VVM85332.1 hypothetical protein PS655_02527 [Pseudomonas fluorescens]